MHEAKVITFKQDTDETIEILVRCCDDPRTDSWHTITVTADHTPEVLLKKADEHTANKAAQHTRITHAHSIFQALINAQPNHQ